MSSDGRPGSAGPSSVAGVRIAVAGSGGFIGQHLVRRLRALNATVLEIYGRHDCDLRDAEAVLSRIVPFEPTALIHLAASPDKGEPLTDCWSSFHNTVTCALNAARALRHGRRAALIHVGSYKQYGRANTPFREGDAVQPCTAYGIAKQTAEQMVSTYWPEVDVVRVRVGSVLGPSLPSWHLVPRVIRAVLDNRIGDLSVAGALWDPVYIDDLVDALILCLTSPQAHGRVINISGGRPCTARDVTSLIARLMNHVVYSANLDDSYQALPQLGDTGLARELLGWTPQVSIEESLCRIIRAAVAVSPARQQA